MKQMLGIIIPSTGESEYTETNLTDEALRRLIEQHRSNGIVAWNASY